MDYSTMLPWVYRDYLGGKQVSMYIVSYRLA